MDGATVEYDPMLLPDIEPALARLRRAIGEGELIAVYGDFDVDGVTASTILVEGLRGLGGRVVPYLPDRFSEGYGVNIEAIDTLHGQGVSLIVTADCGTSSVDEVAHARKLGDRYDHPRSPHGPAGAAGRRRAREHEATGKPLSRGGAGLRRACVQGDVGAVQRNGPGVAAGALSGPGCVEHRLRCRAAAEREPLAGPARASRRFSGRERPGLRALLETSGLTDACLDSDSIGYTLGPRLNAAGRLAHARLALDLLLEPDPESAMKMALELSRLNAERQQATAAAMELARELLANEDPDAPLIFIGHADIPAGIVGLVAGRLAEAYYRPTSSTSARRRRAARAAADP